MIRILFDSAADIAPNESAGVYRIPITVTVNGTDYADGIDLTADEFYPLLDSSREYPKTSQPSPQTFLEHFEAAKEAGDDLIYIALSSATSGTYQSALIARDMADHEGIYVVDSRLVSHGIGLLVQQAVAWREQGLDASTIATQLEALRGRVRIVVAVDTLEYLHRGGRLSRTAAAVGNLAHLKPVVTVDADGAVAVVAKCLGRQKAVATLCKKLADAQVDTAYPVTTIYTYGQDNVALLEQKLGDKVTGGRVQAGAAIGVHVGPEVFGLLYVVQP